MDHQLFIIETAKDRTLRNILSLLPSCLQDAEIINQYGKKIKNKNGVPVIWDCLIHPFTPSGHPHEFLIYALENSSDFYFISRFSLSKNEIKLMEQCSKYKSYYIKIDPHKDLIRSYRVHYLNILGPHNWILLCIKSILQKESVTIVTSNQMEKQMIKKWGALNKNIYSLQNLPPNTISKSVFIALSCNHWKLALSRFAEGEEPVNIYLKSRKLNWWIFHDVIAILAAKLYFSFTPGRTWKQK